MTPAAYVHLDLDAAQHNLAQVKRLAPDNKIMAVIKANGYGHGMTRMATALAVADGFAVARVDEGVKLRAAGFRQAITVLQGFVCAEELALLIKHELATVIHNPEQISMLQQHSSQAASLSVWLKMDTGMNRLGFKGADFQAAYQALLACPRSSSQLIWSRILPMPMICWMTRPAAKLNCLVRQFKAFPARAASPIPPALSAGRT